MTELKHWMVEIYVPLDQAGPLDPGDSTGMIDQEDLGAEIAETHYLQQADLGDEAIGTANGSYDTSTFAGMGGSFQMDILPIDTSFQSTPPPVELCHADASMLANVGGPLQSMPLSSASFGFPPIDLQNHAIPMAVAHMEGSAYQSPVSSVTTITPAAVNPSVFSEPHVPTTFADVVDDADLSFEMTFQTLR
jgi:hypothetical protein